MEKVVTVTGLVAPLDRANVDTDAIIPKQYLKSIKRTGYGPVLFDEWRYLEPGQLDSDHSKRTKNPDFVLNQPRYQGAKILLARANFGCGSSREHAPWALRDYGFRVLLSSSFAEIFANNCIKNGLLPIVLPADVLDNLFVDALATEGYALTIDLPSQTIVCPDKKVISFDINPAIKFNLVNGLDDIGMTLQHADKIRAFEADRQIQMPWLF